MIVRHEFSAKCNCPIDGGPDNYAVTVQTDADIPVERILSATAKLQAEKIFQEEFTRRLAREIGALVTTVGFHSGVKTTCEAP